MRKTVRMAMRSPVNITLPKDLIERLDSVAGSRNRSAFIEEAVRYRIRREEVRRAWEAARGILKGDPRFPTSEAVIDWLRATRSEKTDPGPG